MHSPPLPVSRDVVLIGGGHTHALVLRMWAMNPLAGARLTLINPGPTAPYSGMLPGHVAGHYAKAELDIDLVQLARFAGARLILAPATGIDREARRVQVAGRPDVAYDLASFDVGITTAMPELSGFDEVGVPAKPLDRFAARWQRFVEAVAAGKARPEVVVIGSGIAGVELALAAVYRLKAAGVTPAVTIVERTASPLPGPGRGARNALLSHLERAGISLLADAEPAEATGNTLRLADGRLIPAGFILGAAGARPHGWLSGLGLATKAGYLSVRPTLQSLTDPALFAVGDCAHLSHAPRPKAGVFAVRQAPVLYHNLRASLTGRPLRAYRPQRDYLKLISTGGKGAVADKWGLRLDGAFLWRWKNRIDQRFMDRFRSYPPMPAADLPADSAAGLREAMGEKPLCGGCGAKVGAGALDAAIACLPPSRRADLISGPGDDAAILRHGDGVQVMTTDHLRAFTEDPYVMARIAAVHALGDIWAMGAEPQILLAQIILPRLAPRLQAETLREIMAGATEIATLAGAEIAGGHTSIGAELTLGFTATGLARTPVTKAGARPGDALILTKALGSGTIMAATMTGTASGIDTAATLEAMQRPLAGDAARLAPCAHAMTDVTGFGLAGHLLEILDASGAAAWLDLEAIPVLPGALALAGSGEQSSLFPANHAAASPRTDLPDNARAKLLYDPQTAGGLLASVPGEKAGALIAALNEGGATAAIIGQIRSGTPKITRR
ncbi:MAG: selenide, water dikinase SelD [Paracoccaceae bacterium]